MLDEKLISKSVKTHEQDIISEDLDHNFQTTSCFEGDELLIFDVSALNQTSVERL